MQLIIVNILSKTLCKYIHYFLTVIAATSGNLVIQVQHGFSFKKTG